MSSRDLKNYSDKQVIIIGYEPSVDNIFKSILRDEVRCKVEIVDYVNNLIEKVLEFQPNLILITTFRHTKLINIFKNDPDLESVPIILLSGAATIDEFRASGADDFLSKPVDVNQLFNKVKYFLG